MSAGINSERDGSAPVPLDPAAAPAWMKRLIDNVADVPNAYRRRLPADVLAMITAANATATLTHSQSATRRYWCCSPARGNRRPADFPTAPICWSPSARRRCATMPVRPPSPAGRPIPTTTAPWSPRCGRRTRKPASTPAGCGRWSPSIGCSSRRRDSTSCPCWPTRLIPARLASSTRAEAAIVARVPVRAFINPKNRLMVYREQNTRRFAGPAFLLNQMLVWGFTGQVISATPRRRGLGRAVEQ